MLGGKPWRQKRSPGHQLLIAHSWDHLTAFCGGHGNPGPLPHGLLPGNLQRILWIFAEWMVQQRDNKQWWVPVFSSFCLSYAVEKLPANSDETINSFYHCTSLSCCHKPKQEVTQVKVPSTLLRKKLLSGEGCTKQSERAKKKPQHWKTIKWVYRPLLCRHLQLV